MIATGRLAQLIRARTFQGIKPKRRKAPKALQPTLIELEYGKALNAFLRPVFERTKTLLNAHLGIRLDADDPSNVLDRIIAEILDTINISDLRAIVALFARRTSDWQRAQFRKTLYAVTGVDPFIGDLALAEHLSAFVSENVLLIKSIPQNLLTGLSESVFAAARSGVRHEVLAKELSRKFAVSEKRARLIARDQIGSFNATLDKTRQQEFGITHYIWRSANDARVRPEHQAREGKRFSWNDPPSDGHPGQPILCRCYAEPDFSTVGL